MSPAPNPGDESPPRIARPFVYSLLILIALSAIYEWEPWPATSFRLFSQVRQVDQSSWKVTAVSNGERVPYLVDDQDRGFKNFSFRMNEFEHGDEARQDELCRIWFESAPEVDGSPADQIQISKRTWRLDAGSGDQSLPGETNLMYVCDGTGLKRSTAKETASA